MGLVTDGDLLIQQGMLMAQSSLIRTLHTLWTISALQESRQE